VVKIFSLYLVPNLHETFRFVTDFIVEFGSKSDSSPIPRIVDCIEKIGHRNYMLIELIEKLLAGALER
jgi:hypothetical protein